MMKDNNFYAKLSSNDPGADMDIFDEKKLTDFISGKPHDMFLRSFIIIICITGCLTFATPLKAQLRLELDHVALCVINLDSSIAFYSKYFQLDTTPNPFVKFKVKWFQLEDGLQLHMVAGLQDTLRLPMFAHLSFRVTSPEAFAERLKKNGIAFYGGPGMLNEPNHRPDGVTQLLFKDPNGYWIEVNNAPKRNR